MQQLNKTKEKEQILNAICSEKKYITISFHRVFCGNISSSPARIIHVFFIKFYPMIVFFIIKTQPKDS